MRHTISVLVQNLPGVLSQVAGMFAARGFNIDSLVVGETENPELSRMTIVVRGDDQVLEQVRKQLGKLIAVVKVRDFSGVAHVERDLMLISLSVSAEGRSPVLELINIFRGRVVDVSPKSIMIQLTGPEDKIQAFIECCRPYGIKELARTGMIAMARGAKE